ncbi:MAG: preprotein translocase subunit YajC [Candidatus Nanopelagicales bacterium]
MPQNISALLPLLLIAVAFYFLILRPTKARQAAQRETQSRLAPGVRAMTTAGLYGTVEAVDGDDVLLEIAPGVTVRYVAAAIAKVIEPVDAAPVEGTAGESRPSIIEGDTPGS